jgi:hypothetical protein
MRHMVDASSASLMPFVRESVAAGSVVHTDGWLGYSPLESQGYEHEITLLTGKKKTPPELMPRVHRVISLLKRWLIGIHQGAVIKLNSQRSPGNRSKKGTAGACQREGNEGYLI